LTKAFDIVIAGGGAAGVLAAARLAAAHPKARIALLEKDAALGGRLRTTSHPEQREGSLYSYGLNAISERLFDFWQQTLRQDAETDDAAVMSGVASQTKVGILAGTKISDVDIDLWFSSKGARALGGYTAARQWEEVDHIVHKQRAGATAAKADEAEDDSADEEAEVEGKLKSFGHYWSKPRKAPAAVVLEFFGGAFGIPDVWSTHPTAIAERAGFHGTKLRCGALANVLRQTTEQPTFRDCVQVFTHTRIANAKYENEQWSIDAEGGAFSAPVLVVA
jgi:glycine/D-amino acid oxidase-like deaminating enzyme